MAANEQELREAGLILRWLAKNPAERALLLWMAEMDASEGRRATLLPYPAESVYMEAQASIERYVGAATLQQCGWSAPERLALCLRPIVLFPDGIELNYPEMTIHQHSARATWDAAVMWDAIPKQQNHDIPRPVDQRQSQRPQNARSGGSNPPRPTTPRPRRTGV